ncbi:glycoside hydrolase family 27 protein [Pedobacter sp. LMG 31464]|uniref:Alpha-galactosidase n=1 Tax=Pedobacter planticolens TaxID=2679964 RepID=A0A923DWT6_9SPHI|nr:glycoside hydrolase family 27 protein [Pedobacter planticolens]MBB2145444.1 glycoside hydrolase family 27 protein [Pedobacter planticolens]
MKAYLKFLILVSVLILQNKSLSAQLNSLAPSPTPPMGWMSWYTFIDHINEKQIMEVADAMVSSGLRDAGYNLIQLDDGWMAKERDKEGRQYADKVRFPNGIKYLANYLHQKGLKLGIYSSNGSLTCAGYPGSYNHEEIDAKTYAEWGVDYLKYDACGKKEGHPDQELNMRMINAIKKTGRPMLYAVCVFGSNETHLWASKVATMWRTGGDIVQHIERNPIVTYKLWYTNLQQVIGKEAYAGNGHWNDPDNLIIGYPRNNEQTIEEQKAQFSFWSLIAAPLLLSVDVRAMDPKIKAIIMNKEVIAINQDKAGVQGSRLINDDDHEIWVKKLNDGSKAVILFNKKDVEAEIRLNLKDINEKGKVKVRDLWTKQNKTITSSLTSKVAPHGVVMFKINSFK